MDVSQSHCNRTLEMIIKIKFGSTGKILLFKAYVVIPYLYVQFKITLAKK